jgi:hypothetical protein
MINQSTLRELIGFHPGTPVLSVYLNIDPSSAASEKTRLQLRQLLHPYLEEAPQDVDRIQRYFEHEYSGTSRALVVFSCAAADFFEAYPLQLPLRSRARLLNRPYVKPLAALLENYGHIGVALVDLQGARLFHFHLGQLTEQEGTLGESVRQTKDGAGSQAGGSRGGSAGQARSADQVSEQNIREAARFAATFFDEHQVRRILLGGTEESLARFKAHLPRKWQSLVMGSLTIEMTASVPLVMQKAMDELEAWEHQKDERLINSIITAAAKGSNGVVRLDDTLSAVHAGNVQTLVISDGFRAPGYRCTQCAYLSTQPQDACSFCGNRIERIEDAVEFAVRRVLADGGEVEVVKANPRLEEAGNIGALLRY